LDQGHRIYLRMTLLFCCDILSFKTSCNKLTSPHYELARPTGLSVLISIVVINYITAPTSIDLIVIYMAITKETMSACLATPLSLIHVQTQFSLIFTYSYPRCQLWRKHYSFAPLSTNQNSFIHRDVSCRNVSCTANVKNGIVVIGTCILLS